MVRTLKKKRPPPFSTYFSSSVFFFLAFQGKNALQDNFAHEDTSKLLA